jgi:hypothetical protein
MPHAVAKITLGLLLDSPLVVLKGCRRLLVDISIVVLTFMAELEELFLVWQIVIRARLDLV